MGNISTFVSKNSSFLTLMQINTSPVLSLSTKIENEIFEKEFSGISEHFSNKDDNFIKNEEVYTEFKKCLAFENK